MSSDIDVKEAPFGTWQSPITSDMVATSSKSITELYTSGNNVFWGESRPEDGGKVCICTIDNNNGNIIRLSPEGSDVGNRVHEYGGRSSMVADGYLFFTENSDQRIYSMNLETREIIPITQQPYRYADMVYDKYKRAIVAVREDHTTTPPTNAIVAVDIASKQDFILIEGNDFYSSPRISPRGDKLAYITWNHPNMPWDSTQLWIFDRESGATTLVAGKSESIMEPVWSPDNILYFISDRRNGWWNIHRFKRDKIECVYEVDAEVGGPCWTFGHSSYVFVDENKIICDVTFKDKTVLTLFDIPRQIATAFKTRSTAHEFLCIIQPNGHPTLSGRSGHTTNYVYFKSSAHVRPKAVVRMVVDLNSATAADESGGAKQGKRFEISPDDLQVVVSTGGDKLQTIDQNYFSVPESVEFLASGRVFSYGYFYNPKNPRFNTPGNELPPVLVFVHGGPTASTSCDLDLKVQYWTTRGFAVFDVNYGGSTGERLYKQWGIVDVDDCCCGLQYLIDMGRVDPERTCISGGSAGGYTVLSDLFKTGASYYGVSDPSRLAQDTHKFEARYLDNLIGPYPGEKHLYEQRSPLFNVTKLNKPVIFFQGLEDKVVTPVQTESMFAAVKDKKLPASMILFEGEYHGFHFPATVKQCLESEFYFYCKIFGIDVLEPSVPLIIENEDKIQ